MAPKVFFRILSRRHGEMSSFCLNNGFRLEKTNTTARHVTKYSTIHGVFQQPWPGVFSDYHLERGEGPGDEVASNRSHLRSPNKLLLLLSLLLLLLLLLLLSLLLLLLLLLLIPQFKVKLVG